MSGARQQFACSERGHGPSLASLRVFEYTVLRGGQIQRYRYFACASCGEMVGAPERVG